MTNAASPARDHDDDDPIRELLLTCDNAPEEGLAWVDRLDEELRSKPMIMFARFIALRHLAIDGLVAQGVNELGGASVDAIAQGMNAQDRAYAAQALSQIADIDQRDPEYIDALGSPDDRFGQRMVDDICIVNERLRPGSVQQALGWTKLSYFGGERLAKLPGAFDDADTPLIRAAIRTKIRPSLIARSACSYAKGQDDTHRRFVDTYLMEQDFRETATMGDANLFCSVRFFEDGASVATPSATERAPAPPEEQAKVNGDAGGLLAKSRRRLGRWLAGG